MERQRHKGSFLLVEGVHDVKRIRKFLDNGKCSIINCYGKENVIETADIEQSSGLGDVLGLVDADFDRLLGGVKEYDDVIYSQYHDFEVDICSASVIGRYLHEVGDEAKVDVHGGHSGCVCHLLTALKPLSAMRFCNERHALGYSFKALNLEDFFDGHDIDVTAMVDSVSTGKFSGMSHRAALLEYIERYCSADLDLWQLTNGHDLVAALGIALRDRFGARRVPHTWRGEVEGHLRLALDRDDLAEIGLLQRIAEWEAANGRSLLKSQFRQTV